MKMINFLTPFIFLYCWPLFIATLFIEIIVLVQVYELINRIYIEGSGIISNLNKFRRGRTNKTIDTYLITNQQTRLNSNYLRLIGFLYIT